MGNPQIASDVVASHHFTSRAWIEGAALKQLADVSALDGCTSIAAFPDLHPGKHGPVGMAADFEGRLHPALIGTDIGCGVALAEIDLPHRRLKFDRAVDELSRAMQVSPDDWSAGLPLGTLGGGNHFLELSRIAVVFDDVAAADSGLNKQNLHAIVHTGSRSLGARIFEEYQDRHGNAAIDGAAAEQYIARHDDAVDFALRNRQAVVRRAARALRGETRPISDVPHNHVERLGDRFRHRKGASSSDRGDVMVLGSRGTLSYLMRPLPGGERALLSLAHGCGRKLDRASARARFGGKGVVDRESRNAFGGRVVCQDKDLSAEEAAGAYKSIDAVVADLVELGLALPIASFQPLITWKTAGGRP